MGRFSVSSYSGDKPGSTDPHASISDPEEHGTNTVSSAESETAPVVPVEPPPDGGYSWIVLFAMTLINFSTWGLAASYGVYIAQYVANDFFPGARPLDFALIGGMEFGLAMAVSPVATIATRECRRLPVMSFGVLLMSMGYIAASFATKTWHLYLTQGAMVGVGLGTVFIPSIQVLPQWFLKYRSLAGGIASGGAGLGSITYSLATTAMIENLGLAWTFRITGICCFAGNLMGALLIRDRNAQVKPPQLGFAIHLLRRYDCVLILAWGFLHLVGFLTVNFSLSNYAVQVAGLSQSRASLLTAILNIGTTFGRPAVGSLSDYFGRIQTAAVASFLCAVFVFAIWIPATSFGSITVFALLIGATIGVYWQSVGPLCAEVAGLAEVPSFLSLNWMAVVIPTTFSEAAALALRRPNKGRWGYSFPQLFAGLAMLVGSSCLFQLWLMKSREKRKDKLRTEGRETGA